MMNTKVIDNAVTLAATYCETEGIVADNDSIRNNIIDWYEHSTIKDYKMLAATALEFGRFTPLPYEIIINNTEDYFPSCSYWDNYYF